MINRTSLANSNTTTSHHIRTVTLDALAALWKGVRLRLAILATQFTKHVAPAGTADVLALCLKELRTHGKHLAGTRRIRGLPRSGALLRLELGGGARARPGWINLDLRAKEGLTLDLRQPLPFPDESVAEIYTEHFIGCLAYPHDLKRLLSECYRVLCVGGTFTAGVPDAGRAFKAYAAGVGPFYCDKYWANVRPGFVSCPMDELNWLIYMGGVHHHMFDEENLRLRLQEASFVGIRKRESIPPNDSVERSHQTIYVEARKDNTSTRPSASDIRVKHTQEMIDQLASYQEIAPVVGKLLATDRYTILRLAMLISGEWGNTLVVGDRALPIINILDSFKTPSGKDAVGIVKSESGKPRLAQGPRNRVKLADYPPFPFPERHFRRVVTIMTSDDVAARHQILEDASRVLTHEKDGRIYAVVPTNAEMEIPPALVCFHKERLPAEAGRLFILKRATPRSVL